MRINFTLSLFIFIFSLSCGLFFDFHQVAAQCGGPPCTTVPPTEGIAGIDFLTFNRAIVPCGRKCDEFATPYDDTCNCTLCHLLIMAKNIFDLLLAWLIIVSLLMLTSAGVLYIVSSGNASLKEIAKTMVSRTLWGFGIFLLSWLIVSTVLVFIAADEGGGMLGINSTSWNEFNCDTESSPFNIAPAP